MDAANQKALYSSGTKSFSSLKLHQCLQEKSVTMLRQEKTPKAGAIGLLWWPSLPVCDALIVSCPSRPGICPIGFRVLLLDLAIPKHSSRI